MDLAKLRTIFKWDGTARPSPEGIRFPGDVTLTDIFQTKLPVNILQDSKNPGNILLNPKMTTKGNLTTLQGVPAHIYGGLQASNHKLKNLIGGPNIVDTYLTVTNNPLQSLEGLPTQIGTSLALPWLPELGLMRIFTVKWGNAPRPGTVKIVPVDTKYSQEAKQVESIISQYLPSKNFMMCATRLIRGGFEGNAKL